jgi:hypothetical protein
MNGDLYILRPYSRRESIDVRKASAMSGKSEGTIIAWAGKYHLGRKIGNAWHLSVVALTMFLDGDPRALTAYLSGERQDEIVAGYYRRLGLGDLLSLPEFSCQTAACAIPANPPNGAKSAVSA